MLNSAVSCHTTSIYTVYTKNVVSNFCNNFINKLYFRQVY